MTLPAAGASLRKSINPGFSWDLALSQRSLTSCLSMPDIEQCSLISFAQNPKLSKVMVDKVYFPHLGKTCERLCFVGPSSRHPIRICGELGIGDLCLSKIYGRLARISSGAGE